MGRRRGDGLIGIARAYDIDFTPYLSAYGLSLFAKLKNASITTVLGAYPGLTWAKIAKPAVLDGRRTSRPTSPPSTGSIIGLAGSPTVPMFIGQGANGVLEGTPGNKPGIGRGDGVMIAGDVRSLARQYCGDGTTVEYLQYDALSHTSSMPLFAPAATTWLLQRFAGLPGPEQLRHHRAGQLAGPGHRPLTQGVRSRRAVTRPVSRGSVRQDRREFEHPRGGHRRSRAARWARERRVGRPQSTLMIDESGQSPG